VYLGLDLGTSALKALLLDADQRVVAIVSEPLAIRRPQPLWSEQDPDQWWTALDHALLRLRELHPAPMAAVRALGLAGQMHGAVLLGIDDRVLRPAILWNDGRSAAQCDELLAALPTLDAIAGNLAQPGFTAPKLLWVRAHEREVFAATAKVLLPKDWLRLRLSGEHATDCSDASGARGRRNCSPHAASASSTCRGSSKEATSPVGCALRSPTAGGCRRACRSRAAGATTRRALSASASSTPTKGSSRSAPQASSSSPATATGRDPTLPCTRSATPCQAAGTRCRSCCRR
jgi:hypothetical protein